MRRAPCSPPTFSRAFRYVRIYARTYARTHTHSLSLSLTCGAKAYRPPTRSFIAIRGSSDKSAIGTCAPIESRALTARARVQEPVPLGGGTNAAARGRTHQPHDMPRHAARRTRLPRCPADRHRPEGRRRPAAALRKPALSARPHCDACR